MRVLPGGYGVGAPSFLSRLEATLSDYYVDEWHLTEAAIGGDRDWPVIMKEAGLIPDRSRTFLLDRPAPVEEAVRAHVVAHFSHVRHLIGDLLAPADAASLDALLDPENPGSLMRRPDLFVLSATTVHTGTSGNPTRRLGAPVI
ncbi:hypothetical protein BH23ACT5_BH23ACT5_10490 [soil metagenome]